MAKEKNKDYVFMKENYKNFDQHEQSLIESANKTLGINTQTQYNIPANFDYDSLGCDYFRDPFSQKMAIPFSDSKITDFITMKKTLVKPTELFNDGRGYNIYCAYLKGVDNTGKEVLFAFSITRPEGCRKGYYADGEFFKFGMKLDMLVGGKPEGAITLMRFDSHGPDHDNYIINNKLVDSPEKAERIPTPHFHRNNHINTVVSSRSLDYTPAEALPREFFEKRESEDPAFFRASMDSFVKSTNMDVKFNHNKNYGYNFGTMLFLFEQTIGGNMNKGQGKQ